MSKIIVKQSLKLPKTNILGLAFVDNKVWFAGVDKGKILHRTFAKAKLEPMTETNTNGRNLACLAWNGKNFYVVDNTSRQILRTSSDLKILEPEVSLKDLKPATDTPLVFLDPKVEISSLTWGRNLIWMGCKAGYSSSIYALDLKTKRIELRIPARGPKPEGISFDKSEQYFWTLDSRNSELSKYKYTTEFTGQTAQVPVESPTGLAIDDVGAFWTASRKTGELFQISHGGN